MPLAKTIRGIRKLQTERCISGKSYKYINLTHYQLLYNLRYVNYRPNFKYLKDFPTSLFSSLENQGVNPIEPMIPTLSPDNLPSIRLF